LVTASQATITFQVVDRRLHFDGSPITTVGRFDTVEAAQVATDEVWASR
jgi:hypothetical protein